MHSTSLIFYSVVLSEGEDFGSKSGFASWAYKLNSAIFLYRLDHYMYA